MLEKSILKELLLKSQYYQEHRIGISFGYSLYKENQLVLRKKAFVLLLGKPEAWNTRPKLSNPKILW